MLYEIFFFASTISGSANFLPINRFTEKAVFAVLVIACRLAICPTRCSPPFVKATTEGVVLAPSGLTMITASPPSITETTEFVVPKSIPIVFPILSLLFFLP